MFARSSPTSPYVTQRRESGLRSRNCIFISPTSGSVFGFSSHAAAAAGLAAEPPNLGQPLLPCPRGRRALEGGVTHTWGCLVAGCGAGVPRVGQGLCLLWLFKLPSLVQGMEASRLPPALRFVNKREMMWFPPLCLLPAVPSNLSFPSLSPLHPWSHFPPVFSSGRWAGGGRIEAEESSPGLLSLWAVQLRPGHTVNVGGMACSSSWPPRPLPKRCQKLPSIPARHDNQNVSRQRPLEG